MRGRRGGEEAGLERKERWRGGRGEEGWRRGKRLKYSEFQERERLKNDGEEH
jgi:hypothetical protein